MDFPVYHLDFVGNRMLIAVMAILHVVINHSLAIGAMPLITLMEWEGRVRRDERWDRLAHKFLRLCFVVTTTVGALTGVGIWFSTALVNPAAISSLIRVFFWAWFLEWIVFITEVCLILAYYLLWDRWTGRWKLWHIGLGAALSVFSWITMAVIVAILGFMMEPGDWQNDHQFATAVFNPLYFPQLAFRTGLAMASGGLALWLLIPFVLRRNEPLRPVAVLFAAIWVLAWTPVLALGASWYRSVVPETMAANVPVALLTQEGVVWLPSLHAVLLASLSVVGVTALAGVAFPRLLPRAVLVVPFLLAVVLLGYFERVREFIRKPYVIGGYMYANGVRVADLPLLQRDGLLKHATYASTREILPGNRLAAGRDVFALACSRCHTTTGMNGVVGKLENLYGRDEWDRRTMSGFLSNMHQIRPFMPPFPGNADELDAMVEYLIDLRTNREPLPGAQWAGVRLPRPVDDAMRLEAIEATLADGPTPARQKAFASLAVIAGDTADALLGRWLARLQAGQAPPELQLDLLEAARKRPSLKSQLVRYEQSFPKGDPLARFRPTLAGGDAERGQTVFQLKACQSCHRVRGQGGTVGPELAGVGQRQTREYLLESIVYPSAKIAKGYETLVVTTTDGKIVTGVLQSEQAGKLTLVAADGKEIVLPLASVDEREPGPSMMPADFAARLSPGELRDLVEFLATLK